MRGRDQLVASWGQLTEAARALLDAVPECLVVCDADARIVHLHPLAEALLGSTSSASASGPLAAHVVSLEGRPFSPDALRALVERGADVATLVVLRDATGVEIRRLLVGRAASIEGRPLW